VAARAWAELGSDDAAALLVFFAADSDGVDIAKFESAVAVRARPAQTDLAARRAVVSAALNGAMKE
jgi:hypothetical protein